MGICPSVGGGPGGGGPSCEKAETLINKNGTINFKYLMHFFSKLNKYYGKISTL